MRYFFDIHLNGQCQLDEHGQDFRSLEDARNYVIMCGRICLTDGLPRERSVLAQCIIEITDCDGVSDVVLLTDVIRPHGNRICTHLTAMETGILSSAHGASLKPFDDLRSSKCAPRIMSRHVVRITADR